MLISVIVPVYCAEETIHRCVKSILAQTYNDYEIILVDDGSPDSSGEICDKFAAAHECITVIHQENSGPSAARNAGIEKARGEYIMFLDSDDYLSRFCLETLSATDADMVIGTHVRVFLNGRLKHQKPRHDAYFGPDQFGQRLPALLREKRLNYVHANLYKRSVIDKYNIIFEDFEMTSGEDTVFNFIFLSRAESVFVCGTPLHYYFQSPGGLAVKFYPDRYERYKNLDTFLRKKTREMGIYNEEMIKELDRRRVLGSLWALDAIAAQKDDQLSFRQKARCLYRISKDRDLEELLDKTDVKGSDRLIRLFRVGPVRYLLFMRYRSVNFAVRAKVKKLVPKFIKDIRINA